MTDVVTFAARCPQCQQDAVWVAQRTGQLHEKPQLTIDCAHCGPTERSMIDVIKSGVSTQ